MNNRVDCSVVGTSLEVGSDRYTTVVRLIVIDVMDVMDAVNAIGATGDTIYLVKPH